MLTFGFVHFRLVGMLPGQSTKSKHSVSQAEAARRLGVTKWHLNRVLRGHRVSASLLRRYAELTTPQKQVLPQGN